jgi:hypothetical protein
VTVELIWSNGMTVTYDDVVAVEAYTRNSFPFLVLQHEPPEAETGYLNLLGAWEEYVATAFSGTEKAF